MRFVPFLRMAALNGSIVRGEETPQSDIDILIIAKSGRLYTCRFFATLLVHLTGWRRHGHKTAGRLCLNCYLSDTYLDITPEYKKSIPKVVRAYKYMIPLVDDEISKKFIAANRWFSEYMVKGSKHSQLLKELVFADYPKKPTQAFNNMLLGKFGDYLEEKLMTLQTKRIISGRRKGDEIFVSEKAIKLHPKKS